jgi:uncharacterized protein (DUF433 family)
MVREFTKRDIDSLITRHIEPYPGDPGIGEYRLREEHNGYPVWSVIGSLAPDGSNTEQVMRDYMISREAVEAARAFYARHKRAIDDRLAANRAHQLCLTETGQEEAMPTMIELNDAPRNIPDETRVVVTFLPTGEINLRELGIDAAQAAELRARLASFVEDWDSPEMDVYDRYDAVKNSR